MLAAVFECHQPLTIAHVQRLIEDDFHITYSQRRPKDAEEPLDQRLEAALYDLNGVVTDGGVVIGFLHEARARPTHNRRRLWAFEKPTLQEETPTPNFDDNVLGSTR